MLRLCGSPVSSYYNKVKLALLEKDIAFAEEFYPPSQEEGMLNLSPMGKIPFLKLDDYDDTLTESTPIIEYLESAYPRKPKLYPDSVVATANCRQLMAYLDNYVLSVGQKALPMFLFGAPVEQEKLDAILAEVEKGVAAVGRLVRIDPFLLGGQFTAADVAAVPAMRFIEALFKWAKRDNPFEKIAGYSEYWGMIKQRPQVIKVLADQKAALEKMLASK